MNIDRNAPVGVFDSGIGGLTVAREIMRKADRIMYRTKRAKKGR